MGAVKTAGIVWVALVALPSAPRIVTVGREAIANECALLLSIEVRSVVLERGVLLIRRRRAKIFEIVAVKERRLID